MKVALCLNGHFRSFDHCWTSLYQHIVSVYQPDVFAHAWNESFGNFSHPYNVHDPDFKLGYSRTSPAVPPEFVAGMVSRLKPKCIKLENLFSHHDTFDLMLQELAPYRDSYVYSRPRSLLSSVYSRIQCIALKQAYESKYNFKYDAVVCTRWDVLYNSSINLSVPVDRQLLVDNNHSYDGPADIWFYGNSSTIDSLRDQFVGIPMLVSHGNMTLHPHKWLHNWTEFAGVGLEPAALNIKLSRGREWNSLPWWQ